MGVTPSRSDYLSLESHIGVAIRLQKEIPNAHILDQVRSLLNDVSLLTMVSVLQPWQPSCPLRWYC